MKTKNAHYAILGHALMPKCTRSRHISFTTGWSDRMLGTIAAAVLFLSGSFGWSEILIRDVSRIPSPNVDAVDTIC